MAHLGVVAHPLQPAVRDPRRSPRAQGDLVRGRGVDLDLQDARGPVHDALQRFGLEKIEVVDRAEPITKRRGETADPRRRPDEREPRQGQPQRARARALPKDDVQMELFHRRVEDFLDHAREAVHLVDEQHGAVLEIREDRGEIAGPLYGRAARDLYRYAELVGDHIRQ